MGTGRQWIRGFLTAVLSMALAGPAFAAPSGIGKPKDPPAQATSVSAVRPGTRVAKVDPALEAALVQGGQQTFLVKLNAQADVNGAATAAHSGAVKAGMSPAAQRLAQSTAVIQSLRQVADTGQSGLVSLVKTLAQSGAVSSFEQFWIVNAVAVTGDAKAVQKLAERPEVESITLSKTYHLLGGPTGTAAPQGGGSVTSIEWNIDKINAPQAWGLGIDGTGVVVANLDTGVDGTHPALARKWRGADGSDPIYSWFDAVNDNNTAPYDDHDHGTHTMGTLVGSDESGDNQIGVAPGARWIAAKILNSAGSGTDVDILAAGQWILAPGGDPSKAPDVVSNSWGGGAALDEWLRPTIQAWRAAGIVPVFANGNTQPGQTECFVSDPAQYPESIGVGATDINNQIAGFSCHGPSPYGEIKPEVSAPGVGIRSSVPGGGYQGGWSGTSMATPHVAGVAALLRQANASLTVDDIEQILMETATPLTDSQHQGVPNNWYGWGLVNAFDAVSTVQTGLGILQGRVVTSGDDLEPPVITHTVVTEAFAGFDLPVTATVTDNVSLTEVNLYARRQGYPYYTIIPMAQTSGDYQGGTYRGVIPGYLVQIPELQYYIRAVDYGNSPVSTAVFNVAVSRGVTPGWSTDLESDPVGWEHGGTNDPWQWGQPTSGPGTAHSGSNLWATNLAGQYANNTNAYLLMPPIDLTGGTGAVLDFWHWYELESGYDYGDIFVSADYGQTFTPIATFNGVGTTWQKVRIDLNPYAGQVVMLLFNLSTDSSVTKLGWYMDDLALIGPDTVAPAAPTGLQGTADALGAVTVTWDANLEPDLAGYKVYRSATSGSGYELLAAPAAPTLVDSNPPQHVTSYYVVTAVDMWGNESAYSNEAPVTPEGPVILYFDNMENGENGWTHGGTQDQWQLGTPTSGPNAAFSGANAWATNLAGTYSNGADAWLMSPPIALADVTGVTLQFAHWYRFENNYDKGYVEISTDGITWTQLGGFFTGEPTTGWLLPSYDLSAYVGQSVQIRFRMTSDASVTKLGWYVDDVKLLGIAAGGTSDGAWAPTKPAEKQGDTAPLYKPTKPGEYPEEKAGDTGIGIMSLPMDATVTIEETGRSVRTNPANGSYGLKHAAGDYTARVESYGYYPVTQPVTITPDVAVTKNFLLQPMPWGTVTGTVTNARTGEPIDGARVEQLEDLRVGPATTGAEGSYSLSLLVGSYTLKVSREGFKPYATTLTVSEGSTTADAALEPFIGFPGELAYDDGSGENAWAYYDAGNGWAVRMTPDSTKGPAMLKSASVFLWDTSWPSPGGNAFAVAVYDASGPAGAPGQRVAGPINVTGTRGTWNTVDLSSLGLQFAGDFYVAYIQTAPNPNAPGLATDENGPFYDRSWGLVGGQWAQTPAEEGNRMIRASVLYEVTPPAITSPANGAMTNEAAVTIEGTSVDGATVVLFNDGAQVGEAAVAGGHFALPITLHEGNNSLTAIARVAAGETRPSAPVVVTLDTVLPILLLVSPTELLLTNHEVLTVSGTATDEHMATVTVNGQAVTLTGETFSQRIILNEGSNTVTVVATDLAGNTTTVTGTVTLDTALPVLTEVMPAADVTLSTGESLTISFHSEPGLAQVGYRIMLAGAAPTNPDGMAGTPTMTETEPGLYAGTYVSPADTSFSSASISVWANDAAGNYAEAVAAGRLTVVNGGGEPTNQAPVAQITLPKNPKVNQKLTFDGSQSADPDGTILSYHWTFVEQGQTADGVKVTFKYTLKGTYTVLLTVTDDKGATNTATATIIVK
jgi:bacillopeptidase F (M6 metalloprotease family)/subtilisin family serine protease